MINRLIIYSILSFVIILLLSIFIYLIYANRTPNTDSGMVLFYSKTCPHCLKVDGFIDSTQAMSKLNLVQKQIDQHVSEVLAIAKYCRLNAGELQIPLLWTGKVCIIGDEPIIQYLKLQMDKK